MANRRDENVISELRDLASGIKNLSVRFGSLLEDNFEQFSKEDLLDHLDVMRDNIEKLTELSEKKDSPFVSDNEIINGYYDLYDEMNMEYLALNEDIIRRKFSNY